MSRISGSRSRHPSVSCSLVRYGTKLITAAVTLACVLLIAVFKTNLFATVIPLLFPRIGIAFRPLIDRKRGVEPPGTEGSDLID